MPHPLVVSDYTPRPEYPRPRVRRDRWVNLNGEWEFGAGPVPRFDRRILVPFAPQASLSGIGERSPGDLLWYRRRFDAVPADRLLLHFGAVDYRATVWVNGVEVARHEGGHTPFSADITGAALAGVNELVVGAEDWSADRTIPRGKQYWGARSESIFYTPTSGIWQTVWLEPVPSARIDALRVRPDLVAGAVELEVAAGGAVEAVAWLGGEEVGRWSGPPGPGRIDLSRVEAWSPEAPRLYDLEVRLVDGGDRVTSYFGLRTISARDGRLLLNGEPYYQRLVLDQGYFPGGLLTAATDDDLRRDIELAKSLGFNGARKHQKVEDPRWLHWADVLGFLVWGEMANAHAYSPEGEERLTAEWREAVIRDRDHPSIVAWAPVNESFGLSEKREVRAAELVRLYRLTHELDGTRPVVSNDGWEHALTDLCTIHDYASADELRAHFATLAAALHPTDKSPPPYLPGFGHRGEPVLVSEFGGLALAGSGGWGWSEVRGGREFLEQYRSMVEAVVEAAPVAGFCYTQLTDVEQERNGLLTFDRYPKLDPELIRPITETAPAGAR